MLSSGSGPELSALASMDTGESLQYVNGMGEVPSTDDDNEDDDNDNNDGGLMVVPSTSEHQTRYT